MSISRLQITNNLITLKLEQKDSSRNKIKNKKNKFIDIKNCQNKVKTKVQE